MIETRAFTRIPWKSARLNVSGGRWKRGGIVPFHCRSPSVFLIYAGHVEHAALLKIGLACPGGRQTLQKVRSQSADLRAWREEGRRRSEVMGGGPVWNFISLLALYAERSAIAP